MKPIMSLAEKWNPSRCAVAGREIKPQYKSKTNSSKPNTEVFKKKSPIHKPKPNPSKPNPVTHGHVTVVVAAARSSSSSSLARSPLIANRRSKITDRRSLCLCSDAQCSLRTSLKVFLSFSFWLSLSLSLFISLKWKKWNESQIIDRSSKIADRSASAPMQRCSLLPSAVRPSLKVFLSDSQSLSLYLTKWKNEIKFMNQNESLSLYFNSLSDVSKSLSLLNCESLIG